MAKTAIKSGGTARVRFIMLDAELPDGDLSQITQAIQNALKPTTIVQTRIANGGGAAKAITHEPSDPPAEIEETVEEETFEEAPAAPRQTRAKRTPARTPNIVNIDMNAPVSLVTFAQGKDDKSQHKKYMIAAAWLKEHRNISAVNADHIYTCFRSIGWSTNIPDFGQPLRDLHHKLKYFEKTDAGYEINHIGLDYAKKLGGANGAA